MNISPSTPVNFANITGSDAAPDTSLPVAIDVSHDEAMRGLNPLQHVPGVGMIYRAVSGETIPTTMRVAGAAMVGGPLGAIGAGFMSLVEALFTMKPDLSRPSVPEGMSQTGSEAGVQPVTPGTLTGTSYVSLATTTPDFLQSDPTSTALAQNPAAPATTAQTGAAAYQNAEMEWQRSQSVEKGLT